jgi:hypothetical protein
MVTPRPAGETASLGSSIALLLVTWVGSGRKPTGRTPLGSEVAKARGEAVVEEVEGEETRGNRWRAGVVSATVVRGTGPMCSGATSNAAATGKGGGKPGSMTDGTSMGTGTYCCNSWAAWACHGACGD